MIQITGDAIPQEAGQTWTMTTDVFNLERALKRAQVTTSDGAAQFEIMSDEPPALGGTNSYPQPLNYVMAGIGFCLLTQVTRYASLLKLSVRRASCHVEIDWHLAGSVRKRTVQSAAREARIHLDLDSDESPEAIAELISLAKRGCFAEQMLEKPVQVKSTFTLNGATWTLPEVSLT